MNIDVKETTKVDREITISATKEDLAPKLDKAAREYRKKINLPGFRPGQVPLNLIKKRFGKEIEGEQINSFIQETFQSEIVPNHKPVGEPQIIDMKYEEGALEVQMKIGVKPEFEVVDLETITVDKMVHDVTEAEVDEELERTVERNAKWVEDSGKVKKESKVVVDAITLDKDGNEVAEDTDENKELDLSQEENADFQKALNGKAAGDEVKVELGEGDDKESFKVTIKSVLKKETPELNDELVKEISNGAYTELENYRSFIKSQIQDYYDQTGGDLAKQNIMEALIDAHDFEVPEVVINRFLDAYLDQTKQQYGDKLPDGFDEEHFRKENLDQAKREARWAFVLGDLEEKYEKDVELGPEDIDNHLAGEAARYGLPVEMVKNFYAQSGDQLENLRRNIRTDKLFKKLIEVVGINELGKDEYQKKHNKEDNA